MKNLVEAMQKEYLNPFLKQIGFQCKGRAWNRPRGNFLDVITLQAANYGNANELKVTGNVALVIPEFSVMLFDKVPSFFIEADGIFTLRFSDLTNDDPSGRGKDYWWPLTNETIESTGNELQKIVLNKAVPLLNSLESFDDIENFYGKLAGWQTKTPHFRINKALTYWKLGNLGKFEEELSSISKWPEKITVVRQKTGSTEA